MGVGMWVFKVHQHLKYFECLDSNLTHPYSKFSLPTLTPHSHSKFSLQTGGLAQLARAPALHAGGPGFESLILHK
jgi:hypothetical protein